MKEFLTKLKSKSKKVIGGASAAVSTLALSVAVSAEEATGADLSTYSDQIVGQFTSAADDIMPIIIGVLGAGLTIFVVFIGIKFGKKMFKTVSNG